MMAPDIGAEDIIHKILLSTVLAVERTRYRYDTIA